MPRQFGFELTEILLGKRKADGWMDGWVGWLVLAKKAKKEIEKYGKDMARTFFTFSFNPL